MVYMRAKFMMIYDQFCFAFESCNACLLFLFRNCRIFFSRSFVRFLLHGICVFGFRVHELIFSLSRWHKHIFCLYDQFWCFFVKVWQVFAFDGHFPAHSKSLNTFFLLCRYNFEWKNEMNSDSVKCWQWIIRKTLRIKQPVNVRTKF